MSVALVQRKATQTLSSGSAAQVTTFDAPATAGHFIMVTVYARGNTVATITDDGGNTYQRAGDAQLQADGYDTVEVWYAYDVAAASAVTVTLNSAVSWYTVYIAEWSGLLATDEVFDQSAGDSQSGAFTAWTLGTLTPPTNGALVYVACYTSVTVIDTEPSPQTDEIGQWSSRWAYYYLQPAAAAYTASMTTLSDSRYGGKVVTFLSVAEPPPWVPVRDWVEQEIPSSAFPAGVARVLGDLWSEDTGSPLPTIQARLYNITDAVSVGESAELQSATYPSACDFSVTLTPGTKRYRAEVTSDVPEVDIFFSGRGVGP